MRGSSRKGPAEAETIRKEYIRALDAEFITIEMLSVEYYE